MPTRPPTPFFLLLICALFLLVQNGCSPRPQLSEEEYHAAENRNDGAFHAAENPDGTWTIHTENLKLRTLIEEWAKQSGVELAEIAEETEDHRFSADLYELELQTVMKDILPTMGFMYHDREGSVKILTLEDYHALPPVRIDYPVPSKDVDYALRLLSKALGKKNIESEPDPENATIAIKATWAEHDRIQELIDLYGRLEPTPIYPEMVWPDTLPEHFTREPPQKDDSLEEQVRIAHTVEIRHGSATRLADKLRELQPLHPGERLILIPMANRIVLRATGERIQEILEVVSYLDDPVWRSEE